MAQFRWKENKIISIALRDGVFVLAQLLKAPYLLVFNCFRDSDDWNGVDLSSEEVLIFKAATRQLFKQGQISEQKSVEPLANPTSDLPRFWVNQGGGFFSVTLWRGTSEELEFFMIGKEPASLVEKDVFGGNEGQVEIIKPILTPGDWPQIKDLETNSLAVYPSFNERLSLCYELKKNVDPEKELLFSQPLNEAYRNYFKIISGQHNLKNLGY